MHFLKLAILAALGVVMLFSSYTLILGVAALVLFVIGVFTPKLFDAGMKSSFSESPTLGFESEYGIDNEHIWIKNDGLHLQAREFR